MRLGAAGTIIAVPELRLSRIQRRETMGARVATTTVAKVIEITATSEESFEDAIRCGIAKAAETVHGITGAWVKEQRPRPADARRRPSLPPQAPGASRRGAETRARSCPALAADLRQAPPQVVEQADPGRLGHSSKDDAPLTGDDAFDLPHGDDE